MGEMGNEERKRGEGEKDGGRRREDGSMRVLGSIQIGMGTCE